MGYLLEQYKMVIGIQMGDVTFTPHTFLSNQSNSCVKPSQLVLGSRLIRHLDSEGKSFLIES